MMAAIPQDLLDRIRALEREVRELRGRSQMRPAMDRILNGNVVIGEGGSLEVRAPDGTTLTLIGRVPPDYPGGIPQQSFLVSRNDGSVAIAVWSANPDRTPIQPLQIFDRKGSVILADDVLSEGLARPYIPYTLAMTNHSTESTEWSSCYESYGIAQHPRIAAYIGIVTAGQGGQVRLLVNDQVVATGGNYANLRGHWAVPGYAYSTEIKLEIQARRTGAATIVYPRPYYVMGVESAPHYLAVEPLSAQPEPQPR
ncbi:hypothetical protein [Streptomyces celluloflavus]|uniref:hypothetical protein n=1 Tax=Streptomyces celluloflavus TaxID=58344 RepID=UPI0036794BD6